MPTADFTVLKHRLAEVKTRFAAEGYYHIGDTDVDHLFASEAGSGSSGPTRQCCMRGVPICSSDAPTHKEAPLCRSEAMTGSR
jgi:hypothetical protein